MPVEVGQNVGDYEILDFIGKGGMARVFRVRNTLSGRIEAMKVAYADAESDEEIRARFGAEIRTLARLPDHPHIAKLCTAFRLGNEQIMLMEFVDGVTIADIAATRKIPLDELVDYASQTLLALSHAHEHGIIHRDVKPSNIMVTAGGQVKLMDFGIAKSIDDQLKTQAGLAIGSVPYMSPEQIAGGSIDPRSDLWSMGIVLYEVTTGRRPFQGESFYTVFNAILNNPPTPPTSIDSDICPALSEVILKALQKDPSQRFQTANEFRQALMAIVKPATSYSAVQKVAAPEPSPPASKPQAWLYLLTAVLALAVAVLGFYVVQHQRQHGKNPESILEGGKPKRNELPKELKLASGDMVLVAKGVALLGEHRNPIPVERFYIDKTEVRLGAYLRFCREKGKEPPPASEKLSPDLPVTNVTYYDALEFASWAGKRLPTADEWEVAARGFEGRSYPWGESFDAARLNLAVGPSGHLDPVDAFPNGKSPVGALNMIGNALELVATSAPAPAGDEFRQYKQHLFANLVPPLSQHEPFYQARGGSYRQVISPAERSHLVWDYSPFPARAHQPDVGFRCARNANTDINYY